MVFIILLGIVCIAVLASGSMIKGLISGGLGLLLSFVGYQASTAIPRFTFGTLFLYDGFAMIPLVLGLFAVPEMITLITKGGTIADTSKPQIKGMSGVWRGVKDVFGYKLLVLRSNIIGFIAGIVPGVGATPATFIAYGQAKQTSKQPETFGSGNVEGVIASESANNASEAGALLTTLALGIPGSAPMAIVIGTMLILGIKPGPEMLTTHLGLSLTLVWTITFTGFIGVAICLPLVSYLSRLAFVPGRLLAPIVLVVAFAGTFAYRQVVNDVASLLFFTFIGLVMKQYGYDRPALLLGFILGVLFEKYFFIGLKLSGPLFFVRPISLGLIATIVLLFAYEPLKKLYRRLKGAT
jgi:TctA family transporter